MFQSIYPRNLEEHGRSTIGLLEELGELAEAVRVFEVHPKYFLGEAADTFSYIMGMANEHSIRIKTETGEDFSFEAEFIKRYPGLCIQCGSAKCICPAVPEATVGRMSKELSISGSEQPFIVDAELFAAEGRNIGQKILESVGGHVGLSDRLPFDRGDTNRALVSICLRIAETVSETNPSLCASLRAEALKVSSIVQRPGTPRGTVEVEGLLNTLHSVWKDLDEEFRTSIRGDEGLMGELGEILETVRILFVLCSPVDEANIRVNGELRAIKESIKLASASQRVVFDTLPAATPTDFRRELLDKKYDLIHFSGHADETSLIFETATGQSTAVPLLAISEAIRKNGSIKGVILNACKAAKALKEPIANFTIGMDAHPYQS
jgi:NTP pyrophosphatase (non-canonical NTP hydrolase)